MVDGDIRPHASPLPGHWDRLPPLVEMGRKSMLKGPPRTQGHARLVSSRMRSVVQCYILLIMRHVALHIVADQRLAR